MVLVGKTSGFIFVLMKLAISCDKVFPASNFLTRSIERKRESTLHFLKCYQIYAKEFEPTRFDLSILMAAVC